MNTKQLLTVSFFKNYKETITTLKSFAASAPGIAVGLETEADRHGTLPDGTPVADIIEEIRGIPRIGTIWLWDKQTDALAEGLWPKPVPFRLPVRYSYGGAVAKMMLLGAVAQSPGIVRIDPGCCAESGLQAMIERHFSWMAQNGKSVVSGQYTGRLAFRTDWINQTATDEVLSTVARRTGIDPRRQLTGGAAMCFARSAKPPIPFDGVLVWASDDAIYQQLFPDSAAVFADSRIGRDAPGYGLPITEYLVRVASSAALWALWDGKEAKGARADAVLFFDELRRFSVAELDREAALQAIDDRLPRIVSGVEQYRVMLRHWDKIVAFVKSSKSLIERCQLAPLCPTPAVPV